MKKINPIKLRYGSEKRWVNYRLEEVNGRMTKVPYAVDGRKASSIDERTWSTFEKTKAASKQLGIVFTPEKNLLGIDLDKVLDEKGEVKEEYGQVISELMAAAYTYTEVSPSGTGLHLYLALSEPVDLVANRHANFECYTSGRYFTVTGKGYGIFGQQPVREVDELEALSILSHIGYPWNKKTPEVTGIVLDLNDAAKQRFQKVADSISLAGTTYEGMKDEQIIDKMFAAANGEDVKKLYMGYTSAHASDGSKADMALCSHLMFWCRKDMAQVERIWLASPLGSRQKTQERADYRKRTLDAAYAACTRVYEPQSQKLEAELAEAAPALELLFSVDSKGNKVFIQNTENMIRILEAHPEFANRFRYDEFKNILEVKTKVGAWRLRQDHDAITIQTRISILFPCFAKVPKQMIIDALDAVCQMHAYDSAKQYIQSLVWDGIPRLDSWLTNTYQVTQDLYHAKVGANWIMGMVKRIIEPGCKFDYVLVLEGDQGIKKSTSLAILGGDWHVETTMSVDNKDFFMQMQGKVIVEFSEGEILSRTEIKKLKAIITTQSDKYRPPYGRQSIDFPRRCVFAMTTNQTEYLKDETGNRRWLPVACVGTANVAWLKDNRDQILAEAYVRAIEKRETIWEFPEEEMTAAQNARRVGDPFTELIADWYANKLQQFDREKGITVQQVWLQAINGGYANKPASRSDQMNIAEVLKSVMKLDKRRTALGDVKTYRYYPVEESLVEFPEVVPRDPIDVLF